MAYMGLLQFGENKHKEKDKQFAYINTRAKLLDTRTSAKGTQFKNFPSVYLRCVS